MYKLSRLPFVGLWIEKIKPGIKAGLFVLSVGASRKIEKPVFVFLWPEEALTKKYVGIFNNLIKNLKKGHIAGMIYTQVADCETEYNGIFTFDRKILKIDEKIIKEINEKIHPY